MYIYTPLDPQVESDQRSMIPSQSLIQILIVEEGDPQKAQKKQKKTFEQSLTQKYGYLDDR